MYAADLVPEMMDELFQLWTSARLELTPVIRMLTASTRQRATLAVVKQVGRMPVGISGIPEGFAGKVRGCSRGFCFFFVRLISAENFFYLERFNS